MDIKRISDTLVEIDGKVRLERGPARKNAIATPELLSDEVTASHYYAGTRPQIETVFDPGTRKNVSRTVQRTGIDASGKPIAIGEPMDYIDWRAPASEHVWYVYVLRKDRDAKGKLVADSAARWFPEGPGIAGYDAALSAAINLASA